MKILRKITIFAFALLSLCVFTACGKEKNVEGTLEEIMTKLYSDIKEDERPMLANTEVNEENIETFLGTTDIEYKEALASEPMIGSIAHSVVLVRTKDNADIEKIKTEIKTKVNPRKWICVGVEEKDVIVKSKGNLVVLILVEDQTIREALDKAFDNL